MIMLTPLLDASNYSNLEVVKRLILAKADFDFRIESDDGGSPHEVAYTLDTDDIREIYEFNSQHYSWSS